MPGSIPPTCRPPRSDSAQHGLKLTTANQKRRTKIALFSRRIKSLRSVQLLLGKGGIGGAHRNAQYTGWFAGPGTLPVRARGVLNRVLENARNRAVVFGRDEPKNLRGLDFVFQALDRLPGWRHRPVYRAASRRCLPPA